MTKFFETARGPKYLFTRELEPRFGPISNVLYLIKSDTLRMNQFRNKSGKVINQQIVLTFIRNRILINLKLSYYIF